MSDINLAGISQASTQAGGLGGLLLAIPQSDPRQTVGIQPQRFPSWKNDSSGLNKALLFNYEGEQSSILASDVTDHFIEDNSAVQDQIAIRPVVITTQGFVGELNNIPPAPVAFLKTVAEKLTALVAYQPELTESALLAYNNAFFAYQAASHLAQVGVDVFNTINGGINQTVINGSTTSSQINNQTSALGSILGQAGLNRNSQTQQQVYFTQFYGYWQDRTLFTIQTPWAVFQDMVITQLRAIQDEETRMITTFECQFKQLRFASTLVVAPSTTNGVQGRLNQQIGDIVNRGTNKLGGEVVPFAVA